MPVALTKKLEAVVHDLGSQARVARLLGVSPSRVSRWLHKGEDPDAENRRKVEGLEFVLSRLLHIYHPETALKWLQGMNPHLSDFRPIDYIADGRITEVVGAIDAEESLGYA